MDENHPKIKFGKTGVLIINLGTPDTTSWWDIRKYLKEFLSDRRVRINPIIWQIYSIYLSSPLDLQNSHAYKQTRGKKAMSRLYYIIQKTSR